MNLRSGKPLGINTLLFTILFVTLLAYLAIWGWVIWQIWDGDSTDINAAAIYAGSAIGGTLSGFFAFTLGIRVGTAQPSATTSAPTGTVTSPPQMALGITISSGSREEIAFTLLTTLAIWSYAAVGGAAIVTVFFKSGSSPESVKAVASAFVGLVFALFNQVFQSPK
jgi:hypothetical protein